MAGVHTLTVDYASWDVLAGILSKWGDNGIIFSVDGQHYESLRFDWNEDVFWVERLTADLQPTGDQVALKADDLVNIVID